LSIIEQNAPQFFLKSESRPKKIVYLNFRRIDALARPRVACSRDCAFCDQPALSKKAFTISRKSAGRCCATARLRSVAVLRGGDP
jgi:hypothetical protein